MMKRMKVSAKGLARINSELRQVQEAVEMHQRHQMHHKQAFQNHQPPPPAECSCQETSTSTVKDLTHYHPPQDLVPQNTPEEKIKCDMQNLADIILQQAHRIEKQQQELHWLRLHYERQVAIIKSNAEMLGKQLEKLENKFKRAKVQQLGNHSQQIFSAVEELQKCGSDVTKQQTIANQVLNKLLTCETKQRH